MPRTDLLYAWPPGRRRPPRAGFRACAPPAAVASEGTDGSVAGPAGPQALPRRGTWEVQT